MERWNGRVALVTGASTGIGAGICRELVKHGMKVVGCARNMDKLQALASEEGVVEATGKFHPIKVDLFHEKEILAMFEEIRKTFGRLDVCINNAGFAIESGLMSGDSTEWKRMMEVNILALCICTRESLIMMKEQGISDGQIIQMNSIVGHRIPISRKSELAPSFGFYYGTKFMVRGLTEALRQELKTTEPLIRVASISPGIVETEFMARSMDPEIAKRVFSSARCLQPHDVAQAVTYILSTPSHVNVEDVILQPIEMAI